MRFLKFVLISLISTACFLTAVERSDALDPSKAVTQYTLSVWRTSDGLPQNAVTALAQTIDGFLWVGTQAGLARFDGVEFRTFDETRVAALEDHFISALAADPDGSLWIGTRNGLLHYHHGSFRRLTKADGLPHDYVRSLHLGSSGRLWVGTYGGGVAWRDGDGWRTLDSSHGLPDDVVRALFEDREGSLWIGTTHGLSRWRTDLSGERGDTERSSRGRDTGSLQTWTRDEGLAADFVRSITSDGDRGLWIATHGGGLQHMVDGEIGAVEDDGGMSEQAIWSVDLDQNGSLWSATRGRGLLRRARGRVSALDVGKGLPSNEVFSLLQDREGSLWVGTRQGLAQLKDGRVTTYRKAEGLSHPSVRTLLETSSGSLLVGSSGGGVDRLDGDRLIPAIARTSLASRRIRSMIERRDGSIWIGSDSGLARWQPPSLSADSVSSGRPTMQSWHGSESLPHDRINVLAEDAEGRLWVGTSGGGLCQFETSGCLPSVPGLPNPVVRSLLAESEGLWIGTEGGLSRLTPDGLLRTWDAEDGLPSAIVFALRRDSDGVLWIGTDDGLARFKNDHFEVLTPADGLVGDTVFSILDDDHGYLWLSGDKGLTRLSKNGIDRYLAGEVESLQLRRFDEADGMISSECNGGTQPAGWKGSDGRLWFPTIDGLVSVDPSTMNFGLLPPPVVIDSVQVDGEPIEAVSDLVRRAEIGTATTDSTVGEDAVAGAASARSVELPAGSRRFEFHYTAPSFVAPKKTRFRYRLAGFDDDWVDAGNRRTAFYTNIPSGSYRFEVAASSAGGEWATENSDYAFSLRPGPFESLGFYLFAGFGLVVLGFGAARFRSRALRQRQRVLESVVDERTRELAEANRALAQMVSIDSMTGIANHRKLQEALDREWRRGVRSGWPLSVVMIDIDFFKNYNDTYGHQAGDRCLERVASALEDLIRRPGDLVARYGGEEFVALLPRTDREGALVISESFRRAVEALRIEHGSSEVSEVVTVSLGVATSVPQADAEAGELIGEADRALYRAKAAGRNQVA